MNDILKVMRKVLQPHAETLFTVREDFKDRSMMLGVFHASKGLLLICLILTLALVNACLLLSFYGRDITTYAVCNISISILVLFLLASVIIKFFRDERVPLIIALVWSFVYKSIQPTVSVDLESGAGYLIWGVLSYLIVFMFMVKLAYCAIYYTAPQMCDHLIKTCKEDENM